MKSVIMTLIEKYCLRRSRVYFS